MPVAYPLDLRTVIRASKSREQPATFRMVEPRRGYGYAEKSGTDVPVFWTVQFRFTQAEAATFRAWFIYGIDRGVNEWTLPIRTEFGLVTYTVRFLPDSLLPLREDGEVFEYSATIMARAEVVPDGFSDAYIDADFGSVALLCPFSADNADYSSYAETPTVYGSTIDSGVTLFGQPTALMAGGLTFGDNAQYLLGNGAFCIDAHVYPTSLSASPSMIVSHAVDGAFNWNSYAFEVYATSTSGVTVGIGWSGGPTSGFNTGAGTLPLDTWTHIRVRRMASGGVDIALNGSFYVFGIVPVPTAVRDPLRDPTPLSIGRPGADMGGSRGNWAGRMANLRITVGEGRSASDFTPPTAPYPTR